MDRKVPFEVDERYHVYTRGVDKRVIFESTADSERFLALLFLCNDESSVKLSNIPASQRGLPSLIERKRKPIAEIGAYALMPNHFHLIMKERFPGGISRLMQKILTAYSMYFNTKYDRSGPLFTRPFRATHIDSDEYLRWVFAYVHLNPLELFQSDWKTAGLSNVSRAREFFAQYRYSSFLDYVGIDRPERHIIEFSDVIRMRGLDELLDTLAASEHIDAYAPAAKRAALV